MGHDHYGSLSEELRERWRGNVHGGMVWSAVGGEGVRHENFIRGNLEIRMVVKAGNNQPFEPISLI